jgi:uncharacterized ferredoxin-like protein
VTEPLTHEDIRADTVRQVAKLMAAAAITAPKSGGQLFLAGKHSFMETVIVEDAVTRHDLAEWMRARGKERREAIWFRDAEVAEAIDAVLLVGIADWYPPNYDCGACGYATCAEFLHATKPLRDESAELEFVGPTCNLRDIDLGIAVGSAAKTAAIHSISRSASTGASLTSTSMRSTTRRRGRSRSGSRAVSATAARGTGSSRAARSVSASSHDPRCGGRSRFSAWLSARRGAATAPNCEPAGA